MIDFDDLSEGFSDTIDLVSLNALCGSTAEVEPQYSSTIVVELPSPDSSGEWA